ncbi:hypothetical protein MK852_17135 [Shewanella benthica]|uniref:hypothetical protein n=1 Tax=Shewanella benthica TaxID=43661 RepID=UPI00187A7CAA|nr:hypothetical protein [Shewanella benthica]MBE7213950.1 hypothetical protein [Shewanella benthica]MCL1063839.1 hypothetical protein [Shewanella benthica]
MKNIAVLGCFRSGTNYSKSLLESNFDCQVKNNLFGWKHGFIPIISKDSVLEKNESFEAAYFVTKNPFSFLVSLHRYYMNYGFNILAEKDFYKFVTSRIIIFDSSNKESVQLRFSSPIELWNSMNWNYKSAKGVVHVRYEALLNNPEVECISLAKKLGVSRLDRQFIAPQMKVKRMNDKSIYTDINSMETSEPFSSKLYSQHSYMDLFGRNLKAFINKNVDHELLSSLNYSELYADLRKVRSFRNVFSFNIK